MPVPEPLFIAEISGNHLGSLSRAHALVEAAANAGAGAVKLQTYTADTMTLDMPSFTVAEEHELWGGRTLYSLYQEASTPWEWHKELFEHCKSLNMIPFSSPFDPTAVEFLESLDVPMYKIASLETSDHQLIRLVGETGKPAIISTGATKFDEIEKLVRVFLETGNSKLTLLVCTSSYPAKPEDAHLLRMKMLKDKFGLDVGLSDHTLGIGVSVAAVALGATCIEKHLTLRRDDGGADGAFSMEPEEFKKLVEAGQEAHRSLGSPDWSMQKSELESRRLRRSLYIVRDVSAGELLTNENVRAIRPGAGMSPEFLSELIGKRFSRDLAAGTPLYSDHVID
jgi:N-acetylneuraminate synthase